nr:transcription termination factor MTEF1, chloroplastic [Ipomoea trifida]GMD11079.1 transcription termination factor MTEF1, chloroplastic [Ipomoea batatas]
MLLHCSVSALCSVSQSLAKSSSSLSSPSQSSLLKFHTCHRENLRYLTSLGIVKPEVKSHRNPSPESLQQVLSTVNSLKSRGFSEPDIARIALVCTRIFSLEFSPPDIQPVFEFLNDDLAASGEESRDLVMRCPYLLESNVEFCLKPTLAYLRELGLEKLNLPTTLNAHLLNTRLKKLQEILWFLQDAGLSRHESAKICCRFPAIFGYGIESNLKPKFSYLVRDMKRDVGELLEFPQYFAFSLRKRIIPRHLYLKQKNVKISLKRMLLWSDEKFYTKWMKVQ